MPRFLTNLAISSILALGFAIPAQGQANPQSTPDQAQPEKDAREYRYVYYPMQQIYYAPEQQVWFWPEGSGWRLDVYLPDEYRSEIGAGVPVMLNSARPYQEHDYVEKRYGQPWRARNRETADKRQRARSRAQNSDEDNG